MTVYAVVFDIGNVLLEWHPERYFDQYNWPRAAPRHVCGCRFTCDE